MRKNLFMVAALFLIFSLWQTSYVFAADQPIMTLEEVERLIDLSPNKEVKAYFKSVERGAKLSTYRVILRGVFRQPGLKVIMCVTSHKIVAGMSGSPVFIGNKKIGALAYNFSTFAFSDYSWGGISPISSMMEEAESVHKSSGDVKAFNYQGMIFEPIATGYDLIPGLESVAGGKFVVTTSPASQAIPSQAAGSALKAGMPIVVDLVEWTDEKGGTTTISAMGTITHVGEDGKIFAFGHPFLGSRGVVYSFRTTEVIGTIYSEAGSTKIGGRTSGVMGAITLDGVYGISGSTSLGELSKLRHFNLEFKKEGESLHRFDVKVADSVLSPLLTQIAFEMIGNANGAPFPQEASATQLETKVELQGHKPVAWKEIFASMSTKFGPDTIYKSSYAAACEAFFDAIYDPIFNNRYGLKISDVSISANFMPGRNQVLKLGAYRFPNKVIYGQDPVLDVLFVDENNTMPIAARVTVKIDWDKVEKPVYKRNTVETEKNNEKIVWGILRIDSADSFFRNLTDSEKNEFLPEYFLGAEDFLENLSRQLEATNQKLYARARLRARSGLFDEAITQAEEIMPEMYNITVSNTNSGWYMIEGGLTKRKNTVKNEGMVTFYVDLPQVPNSYVVDQSTNKSIMFEVVLEN